MRRRPFGGTSCPSFGALNFVLEGVLDGGVNEALGLDTHGKTLAFLLLGLEIAAPADLARLLSPRVAGGGACLPFSDC